MYFRDTRLVVDLDIIKNNILYFKNRQKDKDVFLVVKANGYGLGDKILADLAEETGCSYLCVSSVDEAIALRLQGCEMPILCFGFVNKEQFEICKKYDITISVDSLQHAYDLADSMIVNLKCHIKIDTGMNRLGMKNLEEAKEAVNILKEKENIEGIYSHYVDSGNLDSDRSDKQYEKFKSIVENIDYKFRYVHIMNTDAILSREDSITNAVRLGIGYVGISAFNVEELKPAVSLYSKVTICKKAFKDESVGYGGEYIFDKDEWLCTMPIGYADGFNRTNKGRKVYINDEYAQLVGRICMDQCMFITSREYPTDTEVELFGEHISLSDFSKENNTIEHEVLCGLSNRVLRVYKKDGKIIKISHPRLDNYS